MMGQAGQKNDSWQMGRETGRQKHDSPETATFLNSGFEN